MTDAVTQLNEYIVAAESTAQPAAYDYDYLVPGILGEIGEIYGQLAKYHWHEWPLEKLQDELKAEYGDVCWMTAILIAKRLTVHEIEINYEGMPSDFNPFPGMSMLTRSVNEMLYKLNEELEAANLLEEFGGAEGPATRHEAAQDDTDNHLLKLWALLAVLAPVVTGHTFDQVLEYNKVKLASRAERGVLRGAGDHR